MTTISQPDIRPLPVPLPPLPEQRRIAAVLDALDGTIAASEALIAKLRALRQGLLHDLLSCGVDEHGELRDPQRHPEQFKDSAVGRVPRGWGQTTLSAIAVNGITNGFFKKPELVGSGYPLINVSDLYQDFGIDLTLVERVKATSREWRKYYIQPGDCFFTRSSLTLSGISHCNIIRSVSEPALFECHLMRVRPDQSLIVPEFLAHWCRTPLAQSFFMARAKQVTMTTIAQPDIASLPVPLPPKEEQTAIIQTIDFHDARLRAEEAQLAKLRQLKAGMMDDLLSGRVRVPEGM